MTLREFLGEGQTFFHVQAFNEGQWKGREEVQATERTCIVAVARIGGCYLI